MSRNEIKNVDRMQCLKTMFTVLIAFVTLLIPITFGSVGMKMTYEMLPFTDKTEFVKGMFAFNFSGLTSTMGADKVENFANIANIAFMAFYGILAFDFVMSLILIITGSEFLRKVMKLITIILGLVMLLIAVLFIMDIVGFVMLITQGTIPPDYLMNGLEVSGILSTLGQIIFAIAIGFKQFGWFSKYYNDREDDNSNERKSKRNKKSRSHQISENEFEDDSETYDSYEY